MTSQLGHPAAWRKAHRRRLALVGLGPTEQHLLLVLDMLGARDPARLVNRLPAPDVGAPPLGELDDSRAWLRIWLPRVARPLRHPGCHRYIWPLDRATRLALPDHLRERRVEVSPYPKVMFKPTDPRRRAARRVCPKETAA